MKIEAMMHFVANWLEGGFHTAEDNLSSDLMLLAQTQDAQSCIPNSNVSDYIDYNVHNYLIYLLRTIALSLE